VPSSTLSHRPVGVPAAPSATSAGVACPGRRTPSPTSPFLIAGLYDVLLGVAFFIFGEQILDWIGMELPPHIAYIQLSENHAIPSLK
jgi:hypothetical protein